MAAGSEDLKASAKADYVAGRYQDAVVKYSDLIERSDSEDSDLHVYYSNRAACYQQLKQNQDALSDAQSCVAFKPSFAKGHSRLATILTSLNRHREAVLAWERALELEPTNASFRNSVNTARRKAGMPPSSDSPADGGFGGGGGAFPNFGRAFSGFMGGMGGQGQGGGLVNETITRAIGAFACASTEMKVGYGLGAAFLVYYIFKTVYVLRIMFLSVSLLSIYYCLPACIL
jgi:tetratricopeptide (TPR) repeat protein